MNRLENRVQERQSQNRTASMKQANKSRQRKTSFAFGTVGVGTAVGEQVVGLS